MSDNDLPVDDQLLHTLPQHGNLDGTERLYTVEGDKRFEAEESRSEYEPAAEVPAALADHPHLDLQDWIASGGLAHIYTACEAPFGRKVALKWQRGALEAEDPIIREGVVTGYLDHPNIVPVYRLVEDGEGTTMVMKHIEGRSLADLWDEQAEELSETEHLREGLEVLIEVCQALEYAHSRGIIHRDLKPRNVMVGDFGEVYVIDWGLAAYIGDEDPAADIPVAGNEESLFGTPAYMAPEMVEAEPEKLSTATDQYMLGGLVHYLITDEIPHSGSRPTEILASAYRADPPEYGDEVPDELGAIVRRAMASEPSARFPGMAALRLALESFLEHEHSRRLVDRTHQAASELRKHIGKQEAEEVDVAKIYEKFGKARFGYREALETWPNNDRALEGLQELLEMGARWTFDQGMAEAAMLFLREMPDPPEALRAEVRQLRDEVDAQRRAGLFFEQSPHAVAVVDEQGEITSCNERLVEMFGYDSDALLGEPIECLMPERYRDHHRHHRAVYAEAPEGRPMGTDLELRGLHEDGTEFPIDIELNPVQSDDGMRVMAAVQRLDFERDAESVYSSLSSRAILRHLPQGVFGVSEGRIVYVNSPVVELTGAETVEVLLGESIELYLQYEESAEGADSGVLRTVDGDRREVRLSRIRIDAEDLAEVPADVELLVVEER